MSRPIGMSLASVSRRTVAPDWPSIEPGGQSVGRRRDKQFDDGKMCRYRK